jgi:hypothetical protein
MKKYLYILTMVLTVCSCAKKLPLAGMDGSEIPPAFAHFPDIPFPTDSFIDLKETRALGTGENWVGSLVFTTPYNASSVYDFYLSELPKLQWKGIATVRANISHLTYIRDKRAIQLLIENQGLDSAKITITAIPHEN